MNSAVILASTTQLALRTSPRKGCVFVYHSLSWSHAKKRKLRLAARVSTQKEQTLTKSLISTNLASQNRRICVGVQLMRHLTNTK